MQYSTVVNKQFNSVKRIFRVALATRLTVFLGLMATGSNGWSQIAAPHSGKYIDPTEMMQLNPNSNLDIEALEYYTAIGIFKADGTPTADRGTFSAWKKTLGFSPDPNAPKPDEIRAIYFNNGDLQLGRDMHCRQQTNKLGLGHAAALSSITYACYVSNYSTTGIAGKTADPIGSINLAIQPMPPLATVVMEVTAGPSLQTTFPHNGSKVTEYGDVRFFAYGGDEKPITVAALDSEGNKTLPGLCLACHGGSYLHTPARVRVAGGNFLPFDTATFLYGTASRLTEVAQRESFRRLNQFVKATQPRETIVDLIDGWYQWCGGIDKAGCFIDDALHPFIPGDASSCAAGSKTCLAVCPPASDPNSYKYSCGWGNGTGIAPTPYPNNSPFDARAFYKQVVAKECRTCHLAVASPHNFENYNVWKQQADLIESDVFVSHRMPFGEVPFLDFWSGKAGANREAAKDFMKGFFGCPPINPSTLTGDGTDLIDAQVIPNSRHTEQVGLSLTSTNGVTGCPDHCWWKAVNLAGAYEVFTQDNKQTDSQSIQVNQIYDTAPVVLGKAKFAGVHIGVQTLSLPPAPFTYGGCTISFTWKKDK